MPMTPGSYYWKENNTIWLMAYNNAPLGSIPMFVQMPSGRTSDIDAPMNMPDDVIMQCYDEVIQKLTQRFNIPTDDIKDDIPAGKTKTEQ
jgi:hypothetical protein